jgi:transcriptional regulator with XRE-family HTH domain
MIKIIDDRGLDMKNLSLSAGLSETAVRDWLKRDQDPRVEALAAVARTLGMSLSDLYDGEDSAPQIIRVVGAVSAAEGWSPIDDGDLAEIEVRLRASRSGWRFAVIQWFRSTGPATC